MKMLTPNDLRDIKEHLKIGDALKIDLQKAQDAGVPNVELLQERCDACIDRLKVLHSAGLQANKKK